MEQCVADVVNLLVEERLNVTRLEDVPPRAARIEYEFNRMRPSRDLEIDQHTIRVAIDAVIQRIVQTEDPPRVIDLSYIHLSPSDLASVIHTMPADQLETFDLSHVDLRQADAPEQSQLALAIANLLQRAPKLESLNLSHTHLNSGAMRVIIEALPTAQCLKTLVMNDQHWQRQSRPRSVRSYYTITHYEREPVGQSDNDKEEEPAQQYAYKEKTYKLRAPDTTFPSETHEIHPLRKLATPLKDAVVACSAVTALSLRACHIHAKSARALAKLTCRLESFDLSDNPLGDVGVRFIVDRAARSCTLRNLYLNRVGATNASVDSIAAMLKKSVSLFQLSMAGNDFDDEAIPLIQSAISCLYRLHTLDLCANRFTIAGAESLVRSFDSDSVLQSLYA